MNSDYKKRVSIDTPTMHWQVFENPKVYKKVLSCNMSTETALIKIDKNSKITNNDKVNSVEIFVLEGTYINELGEFPQGSYLRLPKENENKVESKAGCIIFRKINYFTDTKNEIIDTTTSAWLQGSGNLEVMPLGEQTALVKWPKGERFIPHSHWGGEEILVLSGVFMDEHGSYPTRNWTRSPHQSTHFPYVEEETIIFVKTGHLFE